MLISYFNKKLSKLNEKIRMKTKQLYAETVDEKNLPTQLGQEKKNREYSKNQVLL